MFAILRALALAAAVCAGPAPVTQAPPAAPPEGPQFAAPTTSDGIGRVAAPVYVNGRGPFRFVVDTGANRSTLSPHIAEALAIDVDAAPRQLVHGVTGAEPAPTVSVSELRVGRLAHAGVEMAVVSNRIHADADGMLGADQLEGGRLTIDFAQDRVEFTTASLAPPRHVYVLPAQMRFGRLPVVTVQIGSVTAKAVIDTGAERSIGNPALRAALNGASLESGGVATVYGAVGPSTQAEILWAPRLTLGSVQVNRLPILFADTHFFQFWRLEDRPALLIGMDVLGQLDALVIDYRRNQVMLRFRPSQLGHRLLTGRV